MNADQKKEAARAVQSLEDISQLRKYPPFARYFEPRLVSEVKRLRDNILENTELTKDQLWEHWLKYRAAYSILKFMIQDEAACRSMLDAIPREEFEEEQPQPTTGE